MTTTTMSAMRVLISGAGIAGPTLAYFLAKAGARVTVVEKSHSLLAQGQNIDIQGSAVTVVEKMGVLAKIKQFNTSEKGTQFIDPKGRPFAPLPMKQGALSPTSEFEILRGDLATVLYEATKEHPNVKYEFGTTIKEIISNDHDAVKVELSNGDQQTFDLLVAADGQWSRLRKQCFTPESIKVVDKGTYAVYFTIPRLSSDNDWWNVYSALGSKLITLRPDPHGTIRAMFSCMPCNAAQKQAWQEASRDDRKMQEELVRCEFADAGWQAQRLLDAMGSSPDFYLQPMQQIKMSHWSSSRVVCLGDAAHAPTPLTGYGTSLAVIGSYVLAGELSKLTAGEHPSKAFEAYESTFRPFVENIQKIPSFVPAIAHPKTAWKRWLLQACILVISEIVRTPWLVSRLTDEYGEANDNRFPLPLYPSLDDKMHVP